MNGVILPAMTFGSETWSLTKKQRERLAVAQRNMERSMLGITRKDKKRNKRRKTGVDDIVEKIADVKCSWAGHLGRMEDNRWARRSTEWTPGTKRSKGRPARRWRDDIEKAASVTWMSRTTNKLKWILERPSASNGLNS